MNESLLELKQCSPLWEQLFAKLNNERKQISTKHYFILAVKSKPLPGYSNFRLCQKANFPCISVLKRRLAALKFLPCSLP